VLVHFFIDRPVFSAVLSIVITLVGAICLYLLPVAQYPEIVPPTVQVKATYPGASAGVVEESVATPIEQQVNGAEGMMYMQSVSANDGTMTLTVTFEVGRDLDMATVDVQNRVALAEPQLPPDVVRQGITVKKQSPNMLAVINLMADDPSYDALFLSNYATINLADNLGRIKGVGNVMVYGAGNYGMRIWLDPEKLARMNLTVADVIAAVGEQNVQAPAGQIGSPPSPPGQEMQLAIQTRGRLSEPEEFGAIIVRAGADGSLLRVRDVARVEMGSQSYSAFSRLNGKDTASILVYQLPGANALDVVAEVRAAMGEMAQSFPQGISYQVSHDTTRFVTDSIDEVVQTLFEALLLVFLVVFIFLQNGRAVFIPMLAVPVSLIGAFAAFQVLGFSINTLTLFGLVLAIGLVVDDAIVVVEAVQRLIDEEGLSPREAAKKAMDEVTAPVIATSLVLIAVFVPVAFQGGVAGRLYQQFALTLSVSVALSTIVALTLSPALCALLLRPEKTTRGPLGWFFGKFNAGFARLTAGYEAGVTRAIRRFGLVLSLMAVLFGATWVLLEKLPTSFVPAEDQGYLIAAVQLPEGASLQRTDAVMRQIEQVAANEPAIRDILTLGGLNILTSANSSYAGTCFIMLKPFEERTAPGMSAQAVQQRLQRAFMSLSEGLAMAFNPPAIQGLSTTGGFEFQVQQRGGGAVADLAQAAQAFMQDAGKRPEVTRLFTTFSDNVPQVFLDLDRDKTKLLGVPVDSVFQTLQTYLGGYYVNDFNKYGRTYRVMLQAAPEYRQRAEDVGVFHVRGQDGAMVPLSTLVTTQGISGPEYITHFNLYRSVTINGDTPHGFSSGQSIAAMEASARNLPQGYGFEWSGISLQEKLSGDQAMYVFLLALVMVFLFLAALYESWAIPFAVLLTVPLGIFGAMAGQWLRGLENDVYAQIGLVMLIGLVAKNAILIVEFAKMKHDAGMDARQAAIMAARLRFRPILMTSFAFILGVVPLVISTGAGAAARHALGTSVFAGMIAATCLGVIVVPVLYSLIQGWATRMRTGRASGEAANGSRENA